MKKMCIYFYFNWIKYYIFIYSIYKLKTKETRGMSFSLSGILFAFNIFFIYSLAYFFASKLDTPIFILNDIGRINITHTPIFALFIFGPIYLLNYFCMKRVGLSERIVFIKKCMNNKNVNNRIIAFIYLGFSISFFVLGIVLIALSQ